MRTKKALVTLLSCLNIMFSSSCGIGGNYIPANSQTTAVQTFSIVSPASSVSIGNKLKLTPVVTQANGLAIPNPIVEWSVSDEKIAKIDKDGNLSANSDGTVVVSGKVGSKNASITLTVTKLPIFPIDTVKNSKEPSIKSNPSLLSQIKYIVLKLEKDPVNLPAETNPRVDYTLDAIETQTKFVSIAYDKDNKPLEGVSFTWISSDENVATVNNKGIVTPVATGSINLISIAGDKASNIIKIIVPSGKTNINVNFQGD